MKEKMNYNSIDITKLIMATFVVILHTVSYILEDMSVNGNPPTAQDGGVAVMYFLPLAYAFLRIAVPFFFITSGYFFFKKYKSVENNSIILKKYLLRILKLFLFWLICWLPYLIGNYIFTKTPFYYAVVRFVLKGLFPAAWYLASLLYAIPIVCYLDKKMSNGAIVFISSILYVVSVLLSSYGHLFDGTWIRTFLDEIKPILSVQNTPISSFLFIAIGKVLGEKDKFLSKNTCFKLCIVFFISMYFELFAVNYFNISIETDFYFTLIPFSIFFFGFIIQLDLKDRIIYIKCRQFSTLLYVSHCYVLILLVFIYKTLSINCVDSPIFYSFLSFVLTIMISFAVYLLFHSLQKKKAFGFLKYSY